MSRIWTHVDNCLDRATPSPTQQTIGFASNNEPSSSGSRLTPSTSLAAVHPSPAPPRQMSTFSVRSLFSGGTSLTTNITNRLGLSLASSLVRGFRARSEPLPPKVKDEDVEMDMPHPHPRAHSEHAMPQEGRTTQGIYATENTEQIEEDEEDESSQSLFNTRRAPSPALTEADNQDPSYIFERLDEQGIIRRDFAFAPPFYSEANPAFFKADFVKANTPVPATEIFDQFKGLTEIDYRWTQPARTYPVSGKTLRRLLNMGWLTDEELCTRGHAMDFEELKKFDASPMKNPWRPFKDRSAPHAKPSLAERRDMLNAKMGYWYQFDKMRMMNDMEMRRQREEQKKMYDILSEEDKRRVGKGKEREMSPPSWGVKRALEEDNVGGRISAKGPALQDGHPAKRRRLTPERQYPPSLYPLHPSLDPHRQQCMPPVPRSGSSSQPLPGERADTPPFEDPSSQGEGRPHRGTKLVHPKHQRAMNRGLTRTQTFTQL
ncbi:hypothetical protein CPB84DRAFT_1744837 [Gymnopilus junonius]|uniref:Uncharacterized protein n=1 Tax=Gymnopilus junonius TaxID=109634 RepID=A0A9P5TRN4_GYMJU|nr:hypothetical protein CPB84DRAFT_1744837 [Gymnopilus junonius]